MYLGLAFASILGVFCRYGIDRLFPFSSTQMFPWSTFFINIIGSFLIGLVFFISVEKGLISESVKLILMTGFLGSFTTFSAFSLQNFLLIQQGHLALAGFYSVSSVLAGISATFAGFSIGRLIA